MDKSRVGSHWAPSLSHSSSRPYSCNISCGIDSYSGSIIRKLASIGEYVEVVQETHASNSIPKCRATNTRHSHISRRNKTIAANKAGPMMNINPKANHHM
ncbi:unnamed protein product [Ectocarpus fasciculatus]